MLYKHLEKMRVRPGMYGIYSVADIAMFILAYSAALHDCDIKDADCEHFGGFQDFLNKHYLFDDITSYSGWLQLLQFRSSHGQESFDNFYQFFDEYLKETNCQPEVDV
jgi:hypothetical protein